MTPDQYQRVEDLFDKLMQVPAPRREEELGLQCPDDNEVRQEVTRLLVCAGPTVSNGDEPTLLRNLLGGALLAAQSSAALAAGSSIGPYRILEKLGEGGFGTVYKVEQRQPIRRIVALKVIKLGVDTKEVIARFNSERQALARMDHPNIAKVLDAGSTDTGRPYFVMEYVGGRAITRFCDDNRLSIHDRLLLFVQVCDAVTHAHQKAIIHRDIKSSNVLAYMQDGRPQAKVIDFGIAKALTSDRLTDLTYNTVRGAAIGTYETMSPEQAVGSPDIDTRTDVYALGVLLYELLVSAPPFERDVIRSATDAELRRMICEVEPPSPSDRLIGLGEEATRLASVRGCDVAALVRQLRRELEWIPLKAMRKERERRYSSAHTVADDVQNYLQGRPLLAGPESRIYRLKKSLRRNAGLVAAVASIVLALLLGVIGTTMQRDRAEKASRQARDSEGRALSLAEENGKLARDRAAALEAANHQLGLAFLEKSRRLSTDGDRFASAMSAAYAIGFARDASGPPSLQVDPLLRRDTQAWREALDLSVARGNTRLLWRSPAGVHHGATVRCVAFSPDGKLLASASDDETLRLWDLATGKLLQTFDQHAGEISSVCFSPDGTTLAADSGAKSRAVRTWDVASGSAKLNLTGHQGVIRSVCFSPDGKLLASASQDRSIRLWDAASGQFIGACSAPGGEVTDIAFSPDGRTLASSSSTDGTIRLWDVARREGQQVLKGSEGAGHCVRFSPDGKALASASQDAVRLWDVASSQLLRTLQGHSGDVLSVCFSPDGKTLASGSADRSVHVWDVNTGNSIRALSGGFEQVESVRFSPDGKTLAWGSRDNRIHLWDWSSGKSLQRLDGVAEVPTSVSFSPDSRTIASTGAAAICLWDAGTGNLRQTLRRASTPTTRASRPSVSAAFDPDGTTLASTASGGRTITVWDLATGQPLRQLQVGGATGMESSVSFSSDGKFIAAGAQGNAIHVLDAVAGTVVQVLKGHTGPVNGVSFRPDGKTLASASDDNTIRLWDVATGGSRTLRGHTREVTCVRFSPDGALLASGSTDNSVRLWDVSSGAMRSLEPHNLAVNSVSFSPDGKMLASGSADATIRLWDVSTGKTLQILRGSPERVAGVCFSPDGTMLAAAARDGTVSVWRIGSDGPTRPPLEGHSEWVSGVSFSPDGATLATACYDRTLRLWDARTGASRPPLVGHKEAVYCVAFDAHGKTVASGSQDRTVRLWDAASGTPLKTFTGVDGAILSVAFSPDGKCLAAGSRDRNIHLWNADTGMEAPPLVGHPDAVFCLAFSPDGKILASGSRDPSIRLWDMGSREARLLPAVHSDRVAGLSFSPDGESLASGSYDHTVCVWNLKTGQPRWRVPIVGGKGSRNWITCVRFSPDGTTLAASADDGVVRFWDVATGHQLQALQASPLAVFNIDFSPDGRTLACASNDTAVHLWDVRPNVPLRQYLQVYRFEGLDLTPVPAVNLYGSGGFRAETLAAAAPTVPMKTTNARPPDQGTLK